MLKKIATIGGVIVSITLLSQAAFATSYKVSIAGQISDGYSVDRDFKQVPNPTSALKRGDAFMLTYLFDPANSSVQAFYDADPTINIYYGQATDFNLLIGSYTLASPKGVSSFLSTQLWNNYNVSGVGLTDLFGQSVLQQLTSASPIDLGTGLINFSATLNAFDYSTTARNSDLVTEITPLTGYANKSGSFGFLNASTYLQTSFSINGLTASVSEVTAVPEPATWSMMILGMGAVSFAMRRRQKVATRISYAA